MASADQLKALVQSHISRDDNQFYSVAMQVAAHEAKAGHGKLAEELRDTLCLALAPLPALADCPSAGAMVFSCQIG